MDQALPRLKDVLDQTVFRAPDRRAAVRYPYTEEATLWCAGEPRACRFASLSRGGVALELEEPLPSGETVQVAPQSVRAGVDGQPLEAVVRWSSKPNPRSLVHLALTQPAPEGGWLAVELEGLESRARALEPRREGIRVPCHLAVELSGSQGSRRAVLRDLGTRGARLECPDGLPEGPFRLTVPSLSGEAPLSWMASRVATHDAASGQYGVRFEELEPEQYRALLATMQQLFAQHRSSPAE